MNIVDFEQRSTPPTRVTSLVLAVEQLKNVSKIIGYNEHLHELMYEVETLLNEEVELQNEQTCFKEVHCD